MFAVCNISDVLSQAKEKAAAKAAAEKEAAAKAAKAAANPPSLPSVSIAIVRRIFLLC